MKEKLLKIKEAAVEALADKSQDPEALRIRFLGKKGELTAILKQMGKLTPEERPVMGALGNSVREAITNALEEAKENIGKKEMAKKLENERPVINSVARFILKDDENVLETRFYENTFRYVLLVFRNYVRKDVLNKVSAIQRTVDFVKEIENKDLYEILKLNVKEKICKNQKQLSLKEQFLYAENLYKEYGELSHLKNIIYDNKNLSFETKESAENFVKENLEFFTEKTYKYVSFAALLFYCLAKSYSFFTGANHLESGIPLGQQLHQVVQGNAAIQNIFNDKQIVILDRLIKIENNAYLTAGYRAVTV